MEVTESKVAVLLFWWLSTNQLGTGALQSVLICCLRKHAADDDDKLSTATSDS
jgi:hypothetical protein